MRLRIDLAYDGTDFHGWAVQPSLRTVQGTLEHVENTEHVVYAAVLVLALVLGTAMVQLSLRPLRRVAATATKVTELPLDSGDVTLPAGVPDSDPRTEVGRVGAAFNRMLFHVERALGRRAASEARLRRFAADASHELRTPLSAAASGAGARGRDPRAAPGRIRVGPDDRPGGRPAAAGQARRGTAART